MIDICTWRARIGLYRAVRVSSSGRTRAKVLLASSADGVEDWSLLLALSTIMMELVVTVLIIIPLLVLLVDTTTRYYCLQKISDAATILVNPADLLHSETGKSQCSFSTEVFLLSCYHVVVMIEVLYSSTPLWLQLMSLHWASNTHNTASVCTQHYHIRSCDLLRHTLK